MVATAVTAALWLQAYDMSATLRWEALRLAALFTLLWLGWQVNFNHTALALLAVYGVINLAVLPLVRALALKAAAPPAEARNYSALNSNAGSSATESVPSSR